MPLSALIHFLPMLQRRNWHGFAVVLIGFDARPYSASPRSAASIAAMSILRIVIIASIARFAASRSGFAIARISARGVICQEKPHLSLHQPQALSWPPLPTIAFQ